MTILWLGPVFVGMAIVIDIAMRPRPPFYPRIYKEAIEEIFEERQP